MNFHFLTTPPVGTIMKLDAQPYVLVAVEPYRRKDGQQSKLLTWASDCPDCQSRFEVKTGLKGKDLTRRCPEHRNPNVAVGKQRTKIEVTVTEPSDGGDIGGASG